jgi:hypothetical protein
MLSRLLHLTLIAVVAGCPLCCHWRHLAQAGDVSSAKPSCCAHCRPQSTPERPQPPADSDQHQAPCQCFCGLALVSPATPPPHDGSSSTSEPLSPAAAPLTASASALRLARIALPPDMAPVQSGRDICTWHALLLC